MAEDKHPQPEAALTPPVSPMLQAMDELLGLAGQTEDMLNNKNAETPLTAEEKEVIKNYQKGLQKMLDIIAPSSMQVRTRDLILNETYARTLYVYNWPNYIHPSWMSQLINLDATMDIAHYIYPSSNKAIMRMLRKKVTEIRSSMRMLEQRGMVRDPSLEAALQDAEELRDLLARGQEKLFQFGMYVTIYGDDEKRLKKVQNDIESILGGKLVLTKPATLQMEHAFTSSLPFCQDEVEINRNMNTSPLSTSFPFVSSDLTDDHGVLYGINRHNESLVIFDRFDLSNANANIFATSGAGKSFAAKLEILRYLMLGTDVLVIDPENEYTNLCEAVGGSFVPLSIQSNARINPFDLPEAVRGDDASPGEILRSAVINLHGLLKLMLGNLSPSEDGILDKAILDTYALSGITLENPTPDNAEPPTLHQLVDVLETMEGGENMARTLQKYTKGSFAGLFDQPTNIGLDNSMIVFQIRDLEEQLRPIAIYIVLNFIWNRIRSESKRRMLVIDEAWNLMQHDDSAKFLYGIVKRARKYWLGVTTITQDTEDFVNSQYGKPIITNSALQILLKQSPTTVDNLQKLFYMTEGEKYFLLNADVGSGILFAEHKHVAMQIIASPTEQKLITTKPSEVKAIKEVQEAAEQARAKKVEEKKAAMEESTEAEAEPKSEEESAPAAEAPAEEPTTPEAAEQTPPPTAPQEETAHAVVSNQVAATPEPAKEAEEPSEAEEKPKEDAPMYPTPEKSEDPKKKEARDTRHE